VTFTEESPTTDPAASHVPCPMSEFWRRDCERTDPHDPHQVEHRDHRVEATCDNASHAVCRGDHRVWCYGVVDPDSLRGQLEALRPGQRVRVVFEGVVDEPRFYTGDAEWPALSIRQEPDNPRSDMVVLRYTGGHPGSTDASEGYRMRGQILEVLTSVEVLGGCTRKGCGRPLAEHEGVFCP
jgi:hypothetical protein